MQAHIEACLPEEACGLLAGVDGAVIDVIPVENQAHSPVRFRMEPAAQLRAFEHLEAQGWQLLAVFHSHPAGPAHPSPTDIAEAAYDVIHVIWSPGEGGWQARAFLIRSGLVSAVKLNVSGSETP
jgi:proteasome lid subunit RPN8/RPN11